LLVIEGDLLSLNDVSKSKEANFGKIGILANKLMINLMSLLINIVKAPFKSIRIL